MTVNNLKEELQIEKLKNFTLSKENDFLKQKIFQLQNKINSQ